MTRRLRRSWFIVALPGLMILLLTIWRTLNGGRRGDDGVLNDESVRGLYSNFSSFGSFLNITVSSIHKSALLLGHRRHVPGFLTIGVPTVKRPYGAKYLMSTLKSIVDKTSAEEKSYVTVIIFLADQDSKWNKETAEAVYHVFKVFFDYGFFQIIHAPLNIYPNLSKLQTSLHDPISRVKWRSKQNLDFAFIMIYSKDISKYYLQLEDDVVCASNFIQDIKNFIKEIKKPWVCVSFSDLGFIGKMFHSKHLERISFSLLTFFDFMPCDMLLQHVTSLLGQREPINKQPGLFQHIGKFSSLQNKMMPLIDKSFKHFGKTPLQIAEVPKGDNPVCDIQTNMVGAAAGSDAGMAYTHSESYFMAKTVDKNSFYRLVFNQSINVSRAIVTTGDLSTKQHYLKSGTFNTCSCSKNEADINRIVGKFVDGELDTMIMGLKLPSATDCFSITPLRAQENLVIRRIEIFLTKK